MLIYARFSHNDNISISLKTSSLLGKSVFIILFCVSPDKEIFQESYKQPLVDIAQTLYIYT